MYGNFAKIEVMSAEAIGEVQIVKGVISAEYGGMGGHVSMVTKSERTAGMAASWSAILDRAECAFANSQAANRILSQTNSGAHFWTHQTR